MKNYDYLDAMMDDIREWIDSEIDFDDWRGDRDGLQEHLHDDLWADDSVTGNGSGTYTCDRDEAEENLCGNFYLLAEALSEFCGDYERAIHDPEYADVTIRCYLLGQAIEEVLDEFADELEEVDIDDDSDDIKAA